jgi:hypothetical protein
MLMTPPIAMLPHRLVAPPPRITSTRSMLFFEIWVQSTVRKKGSLIGTPSIITSVLMVVLEPKPRMLTGCPVGCSCPLGIV